MQNTEKKENTIMRDGEFATVMQQKEEDKAQKPMEKEQWAMSSMPTGKALLLIQRVLSLHHFLQSSIPQNLSVASKVKPWQRTVCFLRGSLTPSTSGIYSSRKNATLDIG